VFLGLGSGSRSFVCLSYRVLCFWWYCPIRATLCVFGITCCLTLWVACVVELVASVHMYFICWVAKLHTGPRYMFQLFGFRAKSMLNRVMGLWFRF